MNKNNSIKEIREHKFENIILVGKDKINLKKIIKKSINLKLFCFLFLVILSLLLTQFRTGIFWIIVEFLIVTISIFLTFKLLFKWRLSYCYDIFFSVLKIKLPFFEERFNLLNRETLININNNDIKELKVQLNKKIQYLHDKLSNLNLINYIIQSFIYITIFSLFITVLSFATYYIIIDKIWSDSLGVNTNGNICKYIFLSVSIISTSGGTNPTFFFLNLLFH